MFLPGAIYFVFFLIGILTLSICALLAFYAGTLAALLSEIIIKRTKAYGRFQQAEKDSDRWWFNTSGWAGATLIGSSIVLIYAAIGPYIELVKYLKGI